MLTTEVENYPGFPDGITGPELMSNFRAQAARFGAEFLTEKVTRVGLGSHPFRIWVGDPDSPQPSYLANTLIVSTGAQSVMLGLEEEERLIGHGLSTCATCDGFFFREQKICVVGGGDSAMEEALFLTRFATRVTIIHRRDELRASKIMQERAFANDKIDFIWDSILTSINGDTSVESVTVRNVKTGEETTHPFTGVFIAIGHHPNTELFKGQLEMSDTGYILTAADSTSTNIDGVFACGDVQDDTYRQAVTAAGSGCAAAIDAERWLEANEASEPGK